MNLKLKCKLILDKTLSNTNVAMLTDLHRKTVAEYKYRLEAEHINVANVLNYSEKALTDIIQKRKSRDVIAFTEPNWDRVLTALPLKSMTKALAYDEYFSQVLYPMSKATFYRRLTCLIDKKGPVLRIQYSPGQQVSVDFSGLRPKIVDPKTGKVRKVELFVAVLGYSKYVFAKAVETQRVKDWCMVNRTMYEYFGAVPKYLVTDNLKSAVLRTKGTSAGLKLNETFSKAMAHYEISIIPTRSGRPKDKANVELAVLHAQRWIILPLRNHTFFSIDDLNKEIARCLERINNKVMQKAGEKSRRELFAIEKKQMQALPKYPYQYREYIKKVNIPRDYCVEHNGHYYSVPFEYIGKKIDVFTTSDTIEFYHQGEKLTSHTISLEITGYSFHDQHRPKNHRAYMSHKDRHFFLWGSYQNKIVRGYLNDHLDIYNNQNATDGASKSLQTMMELHGEELVLEAIDWATKNNLYRINSIRRAIQNPAIMSDFDDLCENIDVVQPTHSNIRGASYYEDK